MPLSSRLHFTHVPPPPPPPEKKMLKTKKKYINPYNATKKQRKWRNCCKADDIPWRLIEPCFTWSATRWETAITGDALVFFESMSCGVNCWGKGRELFRTSLRSLIHTWGAFPRSQCGIYVWRVVENSHLHQTTYKSSMDNS